MKHSCPQCGKTSNRKFISLLCANCSSDNRLKLSKASIRSPNPYIGYRVYGPRLENTGRWSVSLVNSTLGKQFTMSVARYVMAIGLGRRISKSYHVDHIDMNHKNDKWTNLQLLEAITNVRKGNAISRKNKVIEFTCPICKTKVVKRCTKGKTSRPIISFCSRACSYKYNTVSRKYTDKRVVRDAKKINNLVEGSIMHTILDEEPIGERIPFKTKGMRRVHNFLMRKGVQIL